MGVMDSIGPKKSKTTSVAAAPLLAQAKQQPFPSPQMANKTDFGCEVHAKILARMLLDSFSPTAGKVLAFGYVRAEIVCRESLG